jgi:hypothetical protein
LGGAQVAHMTDYQNASYHILEVRVKHCSVRIAYLMVIATLCCAGVGEAQVAIDNPPAWFASIHPDLTGFRYPPLARQARIGGTVKLKVSAGASEITVESGHQLLIPAARGNLEKWQFNPALAAPIFVEYVFRQTDEVRIVTRRVPRGDAFGRFFLRIFHQPTFRDEQECQNPDATDVPAPMIEEQPERAVRVVVSSGGVCINVSWSVARTD